MRCSVIISSTISRKSFEFCVPAIRDEDTLVALIVVVALRCIDEEEEEGTGAEESKIVVVEEGGISIDKFPFDVPGSPASTPRLEVEIDVFVIVFV